MSNNKDNITKLNRVDRKLVWRIVALSAAVLLVTAVLVCILFYDELNLDAAKRWFKYMTVRNDKTFGVSTFDAHASNDYTLLGDGLAVVSVSGVETFLDDGAQGQEYALPLADAAHCKGKDITLIYELGGETLLAIHKEDGELLRLTADGSFYDADVSLGDTIATATSERGYKTVLRVYDKNQQELFRWFSATKFMPWCAVSPTGEYLASVALGEKDGGFDTTLYLFKTTSEEPVAMVSLGDELVYDLRFTEDETLCLAGENGLSFYDLHGSLKGKFVPTNAHLEGFDLGGEGFALLRANMYMAGGGSAICSADYNGKALGSFMVEGNLLDVSANGKYVAVLTSEELIVLRPDMSVYARVSNSWLATSVLMRRDGTAILITSSAANIYIP